MLELILPGYEPFDQETQTFGKVVKSTKIKLEHSLIAISKWEQIWHKPLLKLMDEGTLTDEEFFDYMYCMIVGSFDKVEFFKRLDDHLLKKVTDYINDPATASRVFTIAGFLNQSIILFILIPPIFRKMKGDANGIWTHISGMGIPVHCYCAITHLFSL